MYGGSVLADGARILVADEFIAARSASERLGRMGHDVVAIANTGQRAIRLAEKLNPDIALIASQLPGGISGTETAEAIRRRYGIPIIYIITSPQDELPGETFRAEPMGFLMPPFSDVELSRTIKLGLNKAKLEKQLKESEYRYRKLFDTLPSGFAIHEIICTPDGKPCDYRFLEVNDSFETLTGLSRKNIVGKTARQVLPDIEKYWIELYGKVAINGEAISFEHYSAGLKKHFGCHAYCPSSGTFAVIFTDITEEKLAEKRMHDMLAFQRTLLNTAPLPIFYMDANLRFAGCNNAFESFFGCAAGQIQGRTIYDLPMPRAIAEKHDQMNRELIASGNPQQYECLVENSDGKARNIIFNKTVFRESDGKIGGIIAAMLDITEQRDAMENERIQRDELTQSSKMAAIGTMVAGVAHDVNNPNQYIKLNAAILKKFIDEIIPMLDERVRTIGDFDIGKLKYSFLRDQLQTLTQGIVDGAEKIQTIIQNMKDFAKPARVVPVGPVNLNEAIQSAVKLMGATIRKSCDMLVLDLSDNLPHINANIQKIEQVVVNLLQNACQALSENSQQIGVRTYADHDTQQIVMEIWDQGRGIEPQDLPNLAKPFFTTKRDSGGTGLGLAVSRKILDEFEGRMTFSSTPGEKTTVRVEFPLCQTMGAT